VGAYAVFIDVGAVFDVHVVFELGAGVEFAEEQCERWGE
jgi:hypothetical protein